jgi:hypothetical protein
MKRIATLILTLYSFTGFSQSIETITEKISNKICDCIKDDISSYAEIKPEFNRCYDKEFNQIFNLVDSDEQKILVKQGALEKVKNGIIPSLNSKCEKIRSLIQSEVENAVEPGTNNNTAPCPTNFEGKDLKRIKKLNGEIIAFNGLVTEVHSGQNNKPYYQVKLEGGNIIWVASLVNSGYEKEGKILRLLGYVSEVGNDQIAVKHNKAQYHILAFCVIDLDNKEMAMMPGSELQVKEWMNGTIPKAKK